MVYEKGSLGESFDQWIRQFYSVNYEFDYAQA
jgi:hypothetical protein